MAGDHCGPVALVRSRTSTSKPHVNVTDDAYGTYRVELTRLPDTSRVDGKAVQGRFRMARSHLAKFGGDAVAPVRARQRRRRGRRVGLLAGARGGLWWT